MADEERPEENAPETAPGETPETTDEPASEADQEGAQTEAAEPGSEATSGADRTDDDTAEPEADDAAGSDAGGTTDGSGDPGADSSTDSTDDEEYERPDPADVSLKEPLVALFVPIAILALGSLLMRDLVWDQFVNKYYWHPIVTDAGFNNVNTISWAILMALLLFLLTRIVQKIGQPVTFGLILAVVPYMMAGSVTRVLEDTGYFVTPLRYFFITPIIYVAITAVAVIWIVIGHHLAKGAERNGNDAALKAFGAFLLAVWVAYAVWSMYGDQLSFFGNPVVLLASMALPYVYFWNYTRQTGKFDQVGVMATFGMAYLIWSIYLVLVWHTGDQWENLVPAKRIAADAGANLRPLVYVGMFAFPAIFTALVYFVAKWKSDIIHFGVFLAPLNLLLIFGQMMDASMTSLGIDRYNYAEKHVLPAGLIRWMEANGPGIFGEYPATTVMMTIKFAVSLLVVWAIDVYAREDMKRYPDLVGLAKMAIIMVGLAPGTRDAVRLAMDV